MAHPPGNLTGQSNDGSQPCPDPNFHYLNSHSMSYSLWAKSVNERAKVISLQNQNAGHLSYSHGLGMIYNTSGQDDMVPYILAVLNIVFNVRFIKLGPGTPR